MGKTTRGHKEYSKEQELKHENRNLRNKVRELESENRQLRRQVSGSRKEIARLDLDRHSYVSEIVQEHLANEEAEQSAQDLLHAMKNTWKCHECGNGHLEIHLYTRQDGTFYYRHCNNCENRTKSQKYDPASVSGIMHEPKPLNKRNP